MLFHSVFDISLASIFLQDNSQDPRAISPSSDTAPELTGRATPPPTSTNQNQAKTREKPKQKKDRLPKLTLQGLKEDSVAECLFDTYKSARITFQFGIKEDTAEDIAEKMVCLRIIHL